MAKRTQENADSVDPKNGATEPFSTEAKSPLAYADLVEHVYDAPFASDASLAGMTFDVMNTVDSYTILKASLCQPILIDPKNLDYDNLLRIVFGKGPDVQAGLVLSLSKWGVLVADLMEVIPKQGSTARYRRGVPCLTVERVVSWARKMVAEAAKDPRAAKLDSRWKPAAESLISVLIQAMFAPLDVTIGMKPVVEAPSIISALPDYDDFIAISQHLTLKEVLVRHDPAKAFAKVDALYQLEMSEAIREYMTDLIVDLNTAGYKAERLVQTGLAVIHAKLLHQAHLTSPSVVDIPAAYFQNPTLAQMTRNFTLISVATEAARNSKVTAILGPHEFTTAIDYLALLQNSAVFLETHPLADAAKYFSITALGNSAGNRAGMIIDSRNDASPSMKAYILRQTAVGHLTELIPGGVTQVAFASVVGAFPSTAEIDTAPALAKQLTRDSDQWQSQHARIVASQWLIGDTAAAASHRLGANPAAFNTNTTTWLLQLAAAAFSRATYIVHTDIGWTFAYLTAPDRSSLAQTVDSLTGTVVTSDALLAIYLSAMPQDQKATIEHQDFDPDVFTKGRVSITNLRAHKLLVDPSMLENDLPTITGIGAGRADLELGSLSQFLEVPAFANIAFISQRQYSLAITDAIARSLASADVIRANSKAMQLSQGVIDLDVRLALLPLYNYLLKISRSAVFEARITHGMNRMIAHAPSREAKLALSVEAVNAELRAEVGVTTVLWTMVLLGWISSDLAQNVIDHMRDASMHSRIGALDGAINNKVMLLI